MSVYIIRYNIGLNIYSKYRIKSAGPYKNFNIKQISDNIILDKSSKLLSINTKVKFPYVSDRLAL